MTNEEQVAAPTRRQLREIERRTGKRPVVDLGFDLDELYDTSRIERNAFGSVVSVVPAEVAATAAAAPRTTAPVVVEDSDRSMTVRAIKPARLVAQQRRRRAVSGLSAAAAVAGVAAVSFAIPGQVTGDAHSADLAGALASSELPKTAVTPAAPVKLDATAEVASEAQIAEAAKAEAAQTADYSVTSIAAPTAAGVEDPIVVEPEAPAEAPSNGGSEGATASNNGSRGGGSQQATASAPATRSAQDVVSGSSSVRSAIVALARSYVGVVPYSMGNTPQSGFACDGLVQWVYSHAAGVSLPRGVGSQASYGRVTNNPQPGDLVVFGSHHIGIYAGNGRIIDAPDFGRYVSERPIWNEGHYFVTLLG